MNNFIKNPFSVSCLTLGFLITANAVIATIFSNCNAGIIFTFALGIVLFANGFLVLRFKKWAVSVICLLTLLFIMITSVFVYGSFDETNYDEDAVLVLGCGVIGDEPGPALKSRIERAAEYCEINKTAVIVVSGGKGDDENISEASAMERYLVSLGIPGERIIKEDKATSTKENFEFSKAILDERFNGEYKVVFITNEYHVFRAERISEDFGYDNISHCHSNLPWYLVIPNGLRECSAIIYNAIFACF